ncbi:hypothetical protein NB545_16435 [Vibrio campbellii]|nr:hypothetical protein [Vibrio campbellii]
MAFLVCVGFWCRSAMQRLSHCVASTLSRALGINGHKCTARY